MHAEIRDSIIARAVHAAPLDHGLDAVLDEWTAAEKIVGAVALVAHRGRIRYARAAGWADREARVPAGERTTFRLASSTKLIVTAAAIALVERGALGLDDPVSHWLPYFRPALADGRRPRITVRHLLTHTSGLSYAFFEPGDRRYDGIDQGLGRARGTLEENLRRLAAAPLYYEPGHEWRYSMSTDVLGAVVAAAAGRPLHEAVACLVTAPLGMTDTAFVAADPARLAAAYVDGEDRAARMEHDAHFLPLGGGVVVSPARALDRTAYPSAGGGMIGTAGDYLRLLEAIRCGGGPLFGADLATALTSHAVGPLRAWTEGDGWGFGLGVAVLLDPAAAGTPQSVGTWQWGGSLGTHWFVDPARELTAVVFTNTGLAGVAGPFPAAVRDAIYGAFAPPIPAPRRGGI